MAISKKRWKRAKTYLVITIDHEAPYSQCVTKINTSWLKVDNFTGGKDGKRYQWFSIPISEVKQLLKR